MVALLNGLLVKFLKFNYWLSGVSAGGLPHGTATGPPRRAFGSRASPIRPPDAFQAKPDVLRVALNLEGPPWSRVGLGLFPGQAGPSLLPPPARALGRQVAVEAVQVGGSYDTWEPHTSSCSRRAGFSKPVFLQGAAVRERDPAFWMGGPRNLQ